MNTTKATELESVEPFVCFHVAMNPRGIRVLRAVSSTCTSSSLIGQHDNIPKKLIDISTCGSIHRIRGGFDVMFTLFSMKVDSFLIAIGAQARVIIHRWLGDGRGRFHRGETSEYGGSSLVPRFATAYNWVKS
jgi:hypothetical protein